MTAETPADAIKTLLIGLTKAQDSRDAAGYRACFADDVLIDQPNIPGWKPTMVSADEWTELAIRHLHTFQETRHSVSDFQIEVDGDAAYCKAASRALHVMAERGVTSEWEVIGTFTLRLKREGGRWLITERALKVEREIGDRDMKNRAVAKASINPGGPQ